MVVGARERWNPWRAWQAGRMRIEVTPEASDKLRKKGGSMSIDFIRPTG